MILNILVSIFHYLLVLLFLTVLLTTLNMKYLLICFGSIIIAKLLYIYFGYCILTLYEKNKYFPTISTLTSKMLVSINLKDKHIEEIIINLGLLLIINKILIVIILKSMKCI